MEWNQTSNIQTDTPQADVALHPIPNWNTSYNNNSGASIRYNISHFIEYQASVMIWRYVAPVILVVGTIGSILSLLVLCRKSLRIQTTMFYLSALAVADLMVLFAGLVRLWLEHAENIYLRLSSRAACKVHNFFVYLSLDLSVWILVAVSIDRCLYVSWPQVARKWCKLRNARIIVSIIFVLSALINIHFIWTYDLEMHNSQHIYANGNKKCYADTSSSLTVSFVENIWPWIDFCIYCLFPFLFMATSNAIIIKQLVRTERNMASYQNFALGGAQRNGTEPRLDRQASTSEPTSPGHMSIPASEKRANKRGELNRVITDTIQHATSELSATFSGCLTAVQVDGSSDVGAPQTLSLDVSTGEGCTPEPHTTGSSLKATENSNVFLHIGDYVTSNVTTIMSGNCQSLTASRKRSSKKFEMDTELSGTHAVETQAVPCDVLHGQTMTPDRESHDESHVTSATRRSTDSFLTESRFRFDSQSDSSETPVIHSKLQSQPIELAVIDELTDIVTPSNLTASFHFQHAETKDLLSEMQMPCEEIRLSKSSERKRAMTNKVHPLHQSQQPMSSDIFSVSFLGTHNTPDACDAHTVFLAKTSEKDCLVNEIKNDPNVAKHKRYALSHTVSIKHKDCVPLNNSVDRANRLNSVHTEEIGTDIDNKPHHQHSSIAETNISTSSVTSPGITLGFPKKLSPSTHRWHTTSVCSDTLAPAPSRRNTSSVSKTLLAVTIMFWVFNAPIVIFIIGQTYIITAADDRGRAVVILAWTLVNILQYMNNALHFFLYCLTGPKFRQELKDLFKECFGMMKRLKSQMSKHK